MNDGQTFQRSYILAWLIAFIYKIGGIENSNIILSLSFEVKIMIVQLFMFDASGPLISWDREREGKREDKCVEMTGLLASTNMLTIRMKIC